jgi:hypothetical protein
MNLKTPEGRHAAINALNKSVIEELRNAGVELEETAVARVDYNVIDIGIYKNPIQMIFASDVTIYRRDEETRLVVGAGGSFNPTSDPAQYWRTIHAASLLKNWPAVVEVVSAHCQKYRELMDRIREENK